MPVIEWRDTVRVHVGELTRAGQLDLWRAYTDSDWYDHDSDERANGAGAGDETTALLRRVADTDAMVAAAATKRIEYRAGKRWTTLKEGEDTTIEHDGEAFVLAFPASAEHINRCPQSLGDAWVDAAIQKNGGLNANLRFFTSLPVMSGKASNAPTSDEPPSSTPTTASSKTPTTGN